MNPKKTCEHTLVRILWHFVTYIQSPNSLTAGTTGDVCRLQWIPFQPGKLLYTHAQTCVLESKSCTCDLKQFVKALFCGLCGRKQSKLTPRQELSTYDHWWHAGEVGHHWGFQPPLNSWMPSPTPMEGDSPRGCGRPGLRRAFRVAELDRRKVYRSRSVWKTSKNLNKINK